MKQIKLKKKMHEYSDIYTGGTGKDKANKPKQE